MTGDSIGRTLAGTTTVLAVLVALDATSQAALAGRFMSGDFDALETHAGNASVLGALVIATAIVVAIRFARDRSLRIDLAVASLLVAGTAIQAAVAAINLLAVHVPLGVALIALSYYQAARALRSSAVHGPAQHGAEL